MADTDDDTGFTLSPSNLLKRIPQQLAAIMREELGHAGKEVADRAREARTGIVLAAIGAVLALTALITLAVTGTIALQTLLPWWAAIAITTGLLAIAAIILVAIGVRQMRRGVPPVPDDAIRDTKQRVRDTVAPSDR